MGDAEWQSVFAWDVDRAVRGVEVRIGVEVGVHFARVRLALLVAPESSSSVFRYYT